MIYELNKTFHEKFKVGSTIWAFQFDRCGGKSGRLHNKAPMFGVLTGYNEKDTLIRNFVPYKMRNGKPTDELNTNKSIWVGKLLFADTYEEAVEQYNKLIQEEIDFYENKLEILRKCIIH